MTSPASLAAWRRATRGRVGIAVTLIAMDLTFFALGSYAFLQPLRHTSLSLSEEVPFAILAISALIGLPIVFVIGAANIAALRGRYAAAYRRASIGQLLAFARPMALVVGTGVLVVATPLGGGFNGWCFIAFAAGSSFATARLALATGNALHLFHHR